jgi:catechol 2,3-dioxygenase-like lactoylglutathione lyase family enzyme
MKLDGVLEAVLYCDDLDVAEAFYTDVLGLERIGARAGRHVFFRCRDTVVLLFDPETTSTVPTEVGDSTIPLHGARGEGHLAFRCSLDRIDAWRDHLTAHDVRIESDVRWSRGGRSIYFRDPAGNSLEIASPELWDPPESTDES